MTSTDPTGGADAWTVTSVLPPGSEHTGEEARLEAVSCASVSLCVVTSDLGDVLTSTDPTGGASAWTRTKVTTPNELGGGNALGGVSCPSVRLCVATASEGNMVSSTDPTGGMGAWSETNVDGTGEDRQVNDVSCVSESLCVASDNSGDILTSTDPTGGASAWTAAHVSAGLVEHVSCTSGLCVATNDNEVISSTDPTGGVPAWISAPIETSNQYGHDPSLDAVACPSAGLCVLGDDGGAVVSATDPTKGASAWTVSDLEIGSSGLTGVSCAPAGLCVAADEVGNVVTSTDPAGGAAAWNEAHVDGHALNGVSCLSAGLCVAVDDDGDVLTSTDPTGGASAWRLADVDGTIPLDGVSCPSMSLCVAIDREGDVVTSTDPTGGAGAWTVAQIAGSGQLGGISCPSEELCVATDEGALLISTSPAGGGSTWHMTSVRVGRSISCPSAALCVAVGGDGAATSTDPTGGESAWTDAYLGGEGPFPQINGLDEVSCAQSRLCVATTYGGNGSPGNVMVSADPTGGAQAWIESNVYGVPLEPPNPILPLGGAELTGVSCTLSLCVVVDTSSKVMVGTPPPSVMPANTSPPVASGTPAPGQALSCSNGSWTGYPPPTFTYQWLRDDTPIAAATTGAYVVQAADQGHGLACQVTASNGAGSESATSNTLQVPAAQAPGGGGSGGSGGASGGGGNSGTLTGTVSNAFVLNGIESVAARGTVRVTLTLPGPGTLQIVGKATGAQLAGVSRTKKQRKTTLVIAQLRLTVSKAGRVVVTLVPTGSAKTVLARRGKLRTTVTITYTPKGGAPRSIVRAVTFRLKRRR